MRPRTTRRLRGRTRQTLPSIAAAVYGQAEGGGRSRSPTASTTPRPRGRRRTARAQLPFRDPETGEVLA